VGKILQKISTSIEKKAVNITITSPTPTGRPGNRSMVDTDKKATKAAITGITFFLSIS